MRIVKVSFFITASAVCMVCFVILFQNDDTASAKDTGRSFHNDTKLYLKNVFGPLISFSSKPSMTKRYKNKTMIPLPKPDFTGLPFEEGLKKRRSARSYTDQPITLSELSQLLYAAQGSTGYEDGFALRAAPSAGALYPFEIYAVVMQVKGLKPGIYHYLTKSHTLEQVKTGVFKGKLIEASLGQEMVGQAAVTFILTSISDRTTYKYGERGYRYVYIEAGHISQNIFLQSVSLGLGSVCVGAFFDDKINDLIGVDGHKETAIYLHCVGSI